MSSFKKREKEEKDCLKWTKKQKDWFLRRDEGKCQFVDFASGQAKNCFNTQKLQVHFIVPPLFAKYLNWPEDEIISPLNGIILCEFHHLDCIHPDIGKMARKMYYYTKDSYKIVKEWHRVLAQARVPYWFTVWDEILEMIAMARTRNYLKKNPNDSFPQKKKNQ